LYYTVKFINDAYVKRATMLLTVGDMISKRGERNAIYERYVGRGKKAANGCLLRRRAGDCWLRQREWCEAKRGGQGVFNGAGRC
jgi:hypothetical protein